MVQYSGGARGPAGSISARRGSLTDIPWRAETRRTGLRYPKGILSGRLPRAISTRISPNVARRPLRPLARSPTGHRCGSERRRCWWSVKAAAARTRLLQASSGSERRPSGAEDRHRAVQSEVAYASPGSAPDMTQPCLRRLARFRCPGGTGRRDRYCPRPAASNRKMRVDVVAACPASGDEIDGKHAIAIGCSSSGATRG